MPEPSKEFKRPPKKYRPKGMNILYEDRDILVVDKVSGLLTVSNENVREATAYYRLTDYVRKGNPKSRNRIFIVHRLDRDTSGVIMFAKSNDAKHTLQGQWETVQKTYFAVVHGAPPEKEGVLTSYLSETPTHRMISVTDSKQGKLAKTGYVVRKTTAVYSLFEIDLLTGRKNQIRVQLADNRCPVVGDKKYGEKEKGVKRLALHAASIRFRHPHTDQEMEVTANVPRYFDSLMARA